MSLGYLLGLIVIVLVTSVVVNVASLAGFYKLGRHLLARSGVEEFALEMVPDMPPDSARRLETAAVALCGLGFEWIGNYRTRAGGETTWVQAFLSADARTFATLSEVPQRQPYVLFSIFENGAYLESNATACPEFSHTADGLLEFNALPEASAAELWQSHVAALSERRILSGDDVLEWAPEQYREVAVYVHRLLAWGQRGAERACQPEFSLGREVSKV